MGNRTSSHVLHHVLHGMYVFDTPEYQVLVVATRRRVGNSRLQGIIIIIIPGMSYAPGYPAFFFDFRT